MTIRGPYEYPKYYIGLSTDTKPLAKIGDEFFETDTKKTYICYDGTNWSEKIGTIASDLVIVVSDLKVAVSDLKDVASDLRIVASDVFDVVSDLLDIRSDIVTVQSDLGDVRSNIASVISDLVDITSDLVEIRSGIISVKSDLADVASDVTETNSDVKSIISDIVDVVSDLADIKSDTEEIQSDVKSVISDLADIISDLTETNSDVKGIVSDLGDIWSDIVVVQTLVSTTVTGKTQTKATTIDLHQAAGAKDLFTGTTQDVLIKSLTFRVPDINVSDDVGGITGISIQTDDTTPQVFINSVVGAKVYLTAEAQLGWTGASLLKVGNKIQLTLIGGTADAEPTTCDVVCEFEAVVSGGNLG